MSQSSNQASKGATVPLSRASTLHWSCTALLAAALISLLTGCQSVEPGEPNMIFGWGPRPLLKPPAPQAIPLVKPAKAVGWQSGEAPTPAEDLAVNAFAQGLDHPRWLYELPNGDILVAETDAPATSSGRGGLLAWFAKQVMRYSGSGYPSADRITLLRDTDQDGFADLQVPFIENLHSPFGMALVDSTFYVANTDAVLAFPYELGQTRISAPGERIARLPANAPNSHWTKNLLAHPNGKSLFVTIGSNSNIGELGAEAEEGRAGIWRLDLETRTLSPYATGLRNPVGMAWHHSSNTLWTVVNERDQLGNDLVPDYLAQVNEGDDFGWPTHYWGILQDPRVPLDWGKAIQDPKETTRAVSAQNSTADPDLSADVENQGAAQSDPRQVPNYALGAHTASLGLAFYHHSEIPSLNGHAIVAQRGSWNRHPRSGYQVIALKVSESGEAQGTTIPVLQDFLSEEGLSRGRPVGVIVDRNGAILVTDDVGDTLWRVKQRR